MLYFYSRLMKDLKCVFDFQIWICFDTENKTNVYT